VQNTSKETEEWFDIEYVAGEVPVALLDAWAAGSASPDMRLPPPNPFIATDFSLVTAGSNTVPAPTAGELAVGAPALVLEEPGLRLFHKAVTSFGTPRAVAGFRCALPHVVFPFERFPSERFTYFGAPLATLPRRQTDV
jgi:secreted Zn-dependent insulinase-like peptidase